MSLAWDGVLVVEDLKGTTGLKERATNLLVGWVEDEACVLVVTGDVKYLDLRRGKGRRVW